LQQEMGLNFMADCGCWFLGSITSLVALRNLGISHVVKKILHCCTYQGSCIMPGGFVKSTVIAIRAWRFCVSDGEKGLSYLLFGECLTQSKLLVNSKQWSILNHCHVNGGPRYELFT